MNERPFGDYVLLKEIGTGCLGKVYLAEHRFIKRQFAIKLLPPELSKDRAFISRFEKEISSLANLDHPNIVKVHNVSFAEGHYFLVMDCIVDSYGETTNLEQYLLVHHCKIQESEIVSILSQLADALDYAHKKKIGDQFFVHRGLKLSNVLIGKKDKGFHVYLSDFGLAKILGEGPLLTKTMSLVADALCVDRQLLDTYQSSLEPTKRSALQKIFTQSYEFLAPEQKAVDSQVPITTRTDSYAFGVIVYYLLMKQFPRGLFPMPSQSSNPLQLDWDNVVARCLKSEPNLRPSSLTELMNKLKTSAYIQKREEPQDHQQKAPPRMAPSETYSESPSHYRSYEERPVAPLNRPEPISPRERVTERTIEAEKYHAPAAVATEPETQMATSPLEEPKPVLKPKELKRPVYEEDPAAVFNLETTVARYIPQKDDKQDIEPIQTDMVIIPGGEYFRGADEGGRDERPRHMIRVSSFALDIHPITNEQFVRFLEVMGGEKDANNNDIIRLKESRVKRTAGRLIIESGYSKHPVVGVTWYGAIAYAKWVGKRLPTEAEWEIAARSGLPDIMYPTGDNIERSQANFFSADTVSVKSYPPNQFGLYDMAGNVYEWCQDWYDYTFYEASAQEPDDPKGPHQGVYRVLRGGCWKSLKDDLRCTNRHRNNPGTVNRTYGFRCAADVK